MMKFYWGCATSSVGIFKTLHKLRKLHHRLLILSKKMLTRTRLAFLNFEVEILPKDGSTMK
jgi:hypothetical protein